MFRHLTVSALCMAVVLMPACSTLPRNEYYTLSSDLQPVQPPRKLSATLRVLPVDVAAPYAETRIAYRQNPYRIHYDAYRYWAAAPARLVRRTLVDCFRDAELFTQVYGENGGGQNPDYSLRTRVREFVEVNKENGRFASLDVDFVFTNKTTGGRRRRPYRFCQSHVQCGK